MKYRVKQTDENIFIPQCRECFLFKWGAIDNIDNFVWYKTEHYSHNETLEKALSVIVRHKKYLESKIKYPKYYKA